MPYPCFQDAGAECRDPFGFTADDSEGLNSVPMLEEAGYHGMDDWINDKFLSKIWKGIGEKQEVGEK